MSQLDPDYSNMPVLTTYQKPAGYMLRAMLPYQRMWKNKCHPIQAPFFKRTYHHNQAAVAAIIFQKILMGTWKMMMTLLVICNKVLMSPKGIIKTCCSEWNHDLSKGEGYEAKLMPYILDFGTWRTAERDSSVLNHQY